MARRKKRLVHRGIYYASRTRIKDDMGAREKVFAKAWEEENKPQQYGMFAICSRLQMLMVKDDRFIPVSQETATAVATIVQWLGSGVGFGFLEQTLKQAGYRVTQIKK